MNACAPCNAFQDFMEEGVVPPPEDAEAFEEFMAQNGLVNNGASPSSPKDKQLPSYGDIVRSDFEHFIKFASGMLCMPDAAAKGDADKDGALLKDRSMSASYDDSLGKVADKTAAEARPIDPPQQVGSNVGAASGPSTTTSSEAALSPVPTSTKTPTPILKKPTILSDSASKAAPSEPVNKVETAQPEAAPVKMQETQPETQSTKVGAANVETRPSLPSKAENISKSKRSKIKAPKFLRKR